MKSYLPLFQIGCLIVQIGLVVVILTKPDVPQMEIADTFRSPPEFSEDEKKAGFSLHEITPITITLRVLDHHSYQIEKDRLRTHPGALGFAQPNTNPCVVTIPSGWLIWVNAPDRRAEWIRVENGHILAHELLHCLRGRWHDEVDPSIVGVK